MKTQPPRKVAVKKKAPAPQVAPPKRSRDEVIADVAREYKNVAASPYFRDTLGVKQSVLPEYMGSSGPYGYYAKKRDYIGFNPDKPVDDAPSGGPLAGDRTPRQVLTHEGAHALDNKEMFPSYYSVERPTFRVPFPNNDKAVIIANALKSPMVQRVMPDGSVNQFNMENKTSGQPRKLMGILPHGTSYQPMLSSEVKAIQALDPYYAIGGVYSGMGGPYAGTNPGESFAQAFTNAAGFLSETAADTTGYREKLGRYEGNTPGAGAIVRDLLMGNQIYKNHPLKKSIK